MKSTPATTRTPQWRGRLLGATASHPVNLAVFRIVVFGELLRLLLARDFVRYTKYPEALRVPLPGYEWIFDRIPLSEGWVISLWMVAVVSCSLASLGLWTRVATLLGTLACWYVLGLPNFFGKISHNTHQLIWFAAILAASRCSDALSLDRAVSRFRSGEGKRAVWPEPSVAYGLPLRFAWLLIGIIYFFPGLAKLLAGPDWYLTDHLMYVLYDQWMYKHLDPPFRVDGYPLLLRAGALGVIVFEIGFVFLVLSRRLRPLAVTAGLGFHLTTRLFMKITFRELMMCYVAFIDWYALGCRLRGTRLPPRYVTAEPSALPRGILSVALVGGLLLVTNVYCGIRDIDSWPFSVYPQFERIRSEATRSSPELVLVRSDGSELRVEPRISRPTVRWIGKLPPGPERDRLLGGLIELVVQDGLQLEPGNVLRIYDVIRSTIPEDRGRAPIRRDLLLEFP